MMQPQSVGVPLRRRTSGRRRLWWLLGFRRRQTEQTLELHNRHSTDTSCSSSSSSLIFHSSSQLCAITWGLSEGQGGHYPQHVRSCPFQNYFWQKYWTAKSRHTSSSSFLFSVWRFQPQCKVILANKYTGLCQYLLNMHNSWTFLTITERKAQFVCGLLVNSLISWQAP